jgi:membrane protein required for colicin V production
MINAGLVGVLAIGLITGMVKGLVRQVIELVGIVASFFVAILFSGWLAAILQDQVGMPYSPSLVVAFLLIAIGGMVGFHFIALAVQKIIHMTFLGWVDRVCGMAVGLIVAMLVTSLLIGAALELPLPYDVRSEIANAEVSLFLRPIAPWLFDAVFNHGSDGLAFDKIFKGGKPI